MRKGLILLLVCVWAVPALAQTESPWREGHKVRGYIRPALKIFEIENVTRTLVGGRISWISRHNFAFGPEAYTLIGNRELEHQGIFNENTPMNHYLKMYYGGVDIEYMYSVSRVFRVSSDFHSGTGVMEIDVKYLNSGNIVEGRRDGFYIFETGINCMVKVSRFSWIEAGIGYRYVRTLDPDREHNRSGVNPSNLSLWIVTFALRYGRM